MGHRREPLEGPARARRPGADLRLDRHRRRRPVRLGPLRFSVERTDHYIETLALRVDAPDGTSLVYSADTGPDWSMDRLGRGVDMALVEATYGTDAEAEGIKHLSAGQAGALARSAGAKSLVLTHFWPGSDLSVHRRHGEAAYGAPVTIASPNERYPL